MLITDDFVMLNFPKTGSSFARSVVKRLYQQRQSRFARLLTNIKLHNPNFVELLLPKIDVAVHSHVRDQHGTLRQIPPPHAQKPIISVTRNPYSRYVSTYLFKWWQKYPPAERGIILEGFPDFPDLSFAEYYDMTHLHGTANRLGGVNPKIELGLFTIQFIQFYFKRPEETLREIDDDYIDNERFRDEIGNVTFLHQENLNAELKAFLLSINFEDEELRFIDSMLKVNSTEKTPDEADYRQFYHDRSLRDQILHRERLLFKIFPEYLPTDEPTSTSLGESS